MANVGDKIRIIEMKDEPEYKGRTGIVTAIDHAGQLHGTWGGCAVIPEVDEYEIIKEEIMEAITIERLFKQLLKEMEKGHGDYTIFVTDDEEANGYHALWFDGETAKEMTKENRKYVEDYNCDICVVNKNKDKAFYIG